MEFPLRFSKICLLNIRDDNAFISPLAIETAFHVLASSSNQTLSNTLNENLPLYFYNYFVFDQDSIQSFDVRIISEFFDYIKNKFIQ